MNYLEQFEIPLKGLGNGVHVFNYTIDNQFFKQFENSPIEEGEIDVNIALDKRPGIVSIDFKIDGYGKFECDRCLTPINVPMNRDFNLLVKYDEIAREEEEIIYLHPETPKLNLAKYLFELVVISIPMVKSYDCESDPNALCDMDMLERLHENQRNDEGSSVWDELKNFK